MERSLTCETWKRIPHSTGKTLKAEAANVLVYDGKNDPWNFFEEVPVIFEIHPKQFREGEYKLPVREFQEYVFWKVFREQQESFLVTAWAQIPAFTCPFERSDERTEILMSAGCIGTLNPGDTFRVVPTFNETFDCLLDVDGPVFTVLLWVFGVIIFFKGFEMVLQYLLNNILLSWFIDRQKVLHKTLCLI